MVSALVDRLPDHVFMDGADDQSTPMADLQGGVRPDGTPLTLREQAINHFVKAEREYIQDLEVLKVRYSFLPSFHRSTLVLGSCAADPSDMSDLLCHDSRLIQRSSAIDGSRVLTRFTMFSSISTGTGDWDTHQDDFALSDDQVLRRRKVCTERFIHSEFRLLHRFIRRRHCKSHVSCVSVILRHNLG